MKSILTAGLLVVLIAGFASEASAQNVTVQTPIPNWTKNQIIAVPLVATFNSIPTPCTWKVTSGSLPTGIILNTAGLLSGTPTALGSSTFTLQATVPIVGNTGSKQFTMVINDVPSFATTTVPDAALGLTYSTTLSLNNGTAPFGFVVTSGAVPPGLALNLTTGAITGTPTVEGSFPFTVLVTDAALATTSQPFVLNVSGNPRLAAVGTTTWTVNRAGFSLEVIATGGDGTYSFVAPTGIPQGVIDIISSDRVTISGTPTSLFNSTIRITVIDGGGSRATLDTLVTINPPPSIPTDSLPDATLGSRYSAQLAAKDGTPAFTYRLVAASAGWIGLLTSGSFTGTPNATGTVDITVEVTDATGATATTDLAVTVNAAPALGAATLPIGLSQTLYETTLPLAGGTAPLTGSVVVGSLPAGLTLSGNVISGTPDAPEYAKFTIRIEDRWGKAVEQDYSITVGRLIAVNSNLPSDQIDGGSRQAFVFDMLAETEFSLKLKITVGISNLDVRLMTIDGSPVDTVQYLALSKKGLKLKKVPIPVTGRFALLLANQADTGTIRYSGKVSGKAFKSLKTRTSFGPLTGDVEKSIPAMKDAVLTITAKVAGKDVPPADFVELLAPSGARVDVGPFLKETKTGFKVAKLTLPAGGDYRLRLRPGATGTATGTLKLAIKVKSPKPYAFSTTE